MEPLVIEGIKETLELQPIAFIVFFAFFIIFTRGCYEGVKAFAKLKAERSKYDKRFALWFMIFDAVLLMLIHQAMKATGYDAGTWLGFSFLTLFVVAYIITALAILVVEDTKIEDLIPKESVYPAPAVTREDVRIKESTNSIVIEHNKLYQCGECQSYSREYQQILAHYVSILEKGEVASPKRECPHCHAGYPMLNEIDEEYTWQATEPDCLKLTDEGFEAYKETLAKVKETIKENEATEAFLEYQKIKEERRKEAIK